MDQQTPARKVFEASVTALIINACAIACFIPPLSTYLNFLASPLFYVVLGVTIAVSHVMFVIYISQTAHRLGRPPLPWALVSALIPAVGGLLSLIVLGTFGNDTRWSGVSART